MPTFNSVATVARPFTRMRLALFAALAGLAAYALPSPMVRAGEVYTASPTAPALEGYDPVAYFRAGRPVRGSETITYRWKDVTWRFASEANRTAFIAEPAAFAPQYGGHCSWAAAQGYTASGDPTAWRIVGGKLYVNYDARVHAEWEKDISGNITKADGNWPRIKPQG